MSERSRVNLPRLSFSPPGTAFSYGKIAVAEHDYIG
jgi:hypothetical protein